MKCRYATYQTQSQTSGDQDAQELIGYFNNIKKTLAEMKVTLSEIKTYREPTVEKMKLSIKSTIWNVRKKKAFNQNSKKKKRIKKK